MGERETLELSFGKPKHKSDEDTEALSNAFNALDRSIVHSWFLDVFGCSYMVSVLRLDEP
jgi:hypothetical protein